MNNYVICAVAISVAITFFLRALPILVFGGERQMPEWLTKLGAKLPPAIMAVLVIYCLKSVPYDWVGAGIPGITAALLTALSFKWKHSTFLSILLGTAVYMILLRVL